jgi:D-alanyl-D-alanine-carboxypeptidase/D-alanyl-D-alanine-endopeptidase
MKTAMKRGTSRLILIATMAVTLSLAAAREGVPLRSAPGSGWAIPSDEDIRALLAERMRHNGVGIVVGVIEPAGRRVVAHGRSGAEDGRALDGDTVFLIGSVTKTFTALLLADMVHRGEVRLDDPAASYLPPGVKMPQRGRPITLQDLATHVSGLPSMPSNFDLQAQPDPYSAYTTERLYAFLSGYTPERAPGEKPAYSNLGVSLLGQLLANRMAKPYETLLKERVLVPLGMHDTAIGIMPDQARRLAPGHDRYLQPVQSWEMVAMQGSGSLRSTVNDMLTFVAAYLHEGGPLQAAMTQQRTLRAPANTSQALGWAISRVGDMEIFGHRGGKEGYRSAVVFDPGTKRGVVVLANARTEDEPGDLAVHLLTGRALEPAPHAPTPPKAVKIAPGALEIYAGRYRQASGTVMTVASRGAYLAIETAPGNGVSTFLPQGGRDFYLNTGNDELTFEVDAQGCVSGLVLHGDGKRGDSHTAAMRIGADCS